MLTANFLLSIGDLRWRDCLTPLVYQPTRGMTLYEREISVGDFIHQVQEELVAAQKPEEKPFYALTEVHLR